MKKLINVLAFLILFFTNNIFSQDLEGRDVWVQNSTTYNRTIIVRVYPVSMVFNKPFPLIQYPGNYDLHAYSNIPSVYNYINGRNIENNFFTLSPGGLVGWNMEGVTTQGGAQAGLGRGTYKFEFYWDDSSDPKDSCIVEWDDGSFGDLSLAFTDNSPGPRIQYAFAPCTLTDIPGNKRIESWTNLCTPRSKVYGNYLYDNSFNNTYSFIPQDFRQDCGVTESHDSSIFCNRTGLLTNNLTIAKNINSRTSADDYIYGAIIDPPTQIIISANCSLRINSNCSLRVKTDPYNYEYTDWYTKIYVMPSAHLILAANNAQLIFENTNWFILEQGSHLEIGSNSYVRMQRGSKYCNKGGSIYRAGYFYIDKGVEYCYPPAPTICYFQDSVKLIIEDTASFEIPDSTVYVFEGSQTALVCKNQSMIKFGKGSKLVFNEGARISADHTTFSSLDSNTTWDGIYLNDLSYDTLKNCTIENALNGINVADNTSLYDVPTVEISNCTFSNKTDQTLLNQVYVNNASNVMIRNNTSSSYLIEGFAAGIILEYCTGGVNVIDNNINYVTSGINVIQSSPYIARNTITGTENSGNGIYLDNSNGTVEYNTISNFENSMLLYYSSPYVLKNHFNDASLSAVALTAVSVPVMKPIISGSLNRWLGGNNYLTGSPENAGITYNSDAYPLIDSGYNVISVGNSLYIQGTLTTELKARVNNWYDDPPVSEKFDAGSMGIDYSEYFDGQTLPGTDYYEFNSIGFGLYDTVYVDDLERNTLSSEDLFIIAYKKEMENRYSDAIVSYKDVVSTYKTSNYAVSSLARIFNCLDKMNAGSGDYNTIKSYYTGIKNSNNYPVQVRELSEDLSIKSKVRMRQINDAISDYETIINNFPNTPKGIHAQINKICLENMLGEGDMMMNGQNNSNHKSKLLTLLNGKEINTGKLISNNLPKHFKLYQNYPNPFNPMTTIKYEIPKDGNIKLTVYDITGREILSINEYRQAGVYTYTFDGTNIASGVYIYKIETGVLTETRKMVLIK